MRQYVAVDIILEYETSSEAIDVTLRSWQGHLVKGRSNRIAVRVRHKSTAVSCSPICDGARVRDAGSYTGMTIRPACEWITVGVDNRDEVCKQSDSYQENEDDDPSSHASEGCLMGCIVLLVRTAQKFWWGLAFQAYGLASDSSVRFRLPRLSPTLLLILRATNGPRSL